MDEKRKDQEMAGLAEHVVVPEGFSEARLETVSFVIGNADAAPFTDEDDYWARGCWYMRKPTLILQAEGLPLQIGVPRDDPSALPPSEALLYVRQTPDPTLISRLMLVNHISPMEPWLQQLSGAATGHVRGEVVSVFANGEWLAGGEVHLFRPEPGEQARDTIMHEWVHLLALRSPEAVAAFNCADVVEPLVALSTSEKYSACEGWAMLGEALLSEHELMVCLTARMNPVHSVIFYEAMTAQMARVPESARSTEYWWYWDDMELAIDDVRAEAQQNLAAAQEGEPDVQAAARQIREHLDGAR